MQWGPPVMSFSGQAFVNRRAGVGLRRITGLVLIGLAAACAYETATRSSGPLLSPVDAHELATAGKLLIIDIRPRNERVRDGVPSAVTAVPYLYSESARFVVAVLRIAGNARDQPIAILCSRGVYSRTAQHMLVEAGFKRVFNIDGGYLGGANDPGWKAWGLPVTTMATAAEDP